MGETAGFKVRVGVILIQNDQILLARQNNKPFWVLPGGTMEPREGLKDCAIREMKEETSLDVLIDRLLYISDFIRQDGKQTVDVVFLAKSAKGSLEMETTENLNDLQWFDLTAFKALEVKPEQLHQLLTTQWPESFQNVVDPYIGCYSN